MKLQDLLNVLESSEEICVTLRIQKNKKDLEQADLSLDLKETEVVSVKTYGCSMVFVEVRK